MKNIYEKLVNCSAAIGMDLKNFVQYPEQEKKDEILARIERNNTEVMKAALQLRDEAMAIYNQLHKIYPVSMGDTLSSYYKGIDAANRAASASQK